MVIAATKLMIAATLVMEIRGAAALKTTSDFHDSV